MSTKIDEDEFGKYLSTSSSINRKILRFIFDSELQQNKELENEVEYIKKNPDSKNNLFFFEDMIDFRTLTKLLEKYNNDNNLYILNDMKNEINEINTNEENYENDKKNEKEEKKIIKDFLKKSVLLRNDIWHNNIDYDNPKKYYIAINDIILAYELFKNKKSIKKPELFEKSIAYMNICLDFFDKCSKLLK